MKRAKRAHLQHDGRSAPDPLHLIDRERSRDAESPPPAAADAPRSLLPEEASQDRALPHPLASALFRHPDIVRGPEPLQRPDPARSKMEKELSELKKEVIEARNLVIKSDNLLKNLHAELKIVARRNDDNYRRTWFASAAAYLLFGVLAGGVSFFASRASVSGEKAQVEVARAEVEAQKKRVDELTAQLAQKNSESETHRVTAQQALGAYRLMSEGEGEGRLKGIDEIGKLDRTKLSALEQKALDERARTLKNELAQSAFERGKIAFRKDDMKGAATDLRRYLTLDPDGTDAVQASFYLGTAQFQLHDYQAAVTNLERFVEKGKGQKNVDYGLLLLGQSHEQLGNNTRAIEVYKQGLATFSASEFAPQMLRRMRLLQSGAAVIPPGGAPAPPNGAAAAPPPVAAGLAPAPVAAKKP